MVGLQMNVSDPFLLYFSLQGQIPRPKMTNATEDCKHSFCLLPSEVASKVIHLLTAKDISALFSVPSIQYQFDDLVCIVTDHAPVRLKKVRSVFHFEDTGFEVRDVKPFYRVIFEIDNPRCMSGHMQSIRSISNMIPSDFLFFGSDTELKNGYLEPSEQSSMQAWEPYFGKKTLSVEFPLRERARVHPGTHLSRRFNVAFPHTKTMEFIGYARSECKPLSLPNVREFILYRSPAHQLMKAVDVESVNIQTLVVMHLTREDNNYDWSRFKIPSIKELRFEQSQSPRTVIGLALENLKRLSFKERFVRLTNINLPKLETISFMPALDGSAPKISFLRVNMPRLQSMKLGGGVFICIADAKLPSLKKLIMQGSQVFKEESEVRDYTCFSNVRDLEMDRPYWLLEYTPKLKKLRVNSVGWCLENLLIDDDALPELIDVHITERNSDGARAVLDEIALRRKNWGWD